MSHLRDRRLRLVLPHTQRTVLIPHPTPAHMPSVMAIRDHLDDLQLLAREKPAVMQGILDATKLAAQPYRKRGRRNGNGHL
jgi:hypothetical protein